MTSASRPRKTKIVATVGPASEARAMLTEMIEAGMNVARLNLSHGTYAEHQEHIERIRAICKETGANVAIMLDTKGVEIRCGRLAGGAVNLERGATFRLYLDNRMGDSTGVPISYQTLGTEVQKGVPILLDDGAMELVVTALEPEAVVCEVVRGGVLRSGKGINLPDTMLSGSVLGEGNRQDIEFAARQNVEYIAASFIQSDDDIADIRGVLKDCGAEIPIIAKIENKAGVKNLEAIVAVADGTMVARGDLGVELSVAEVPVTQKKIIRTTVSNGRPVITATQMLDSMERNLRPTRAEVSDVANAILDGSSAVMLSGETAIGEYPVEAIRTMSSLALRAEASLREYGYLQKILPHPSNRVTEAVSQAAITMANHINAAAIFSLTETGFTSRLISKYRPECLNLAITSSWQVVRRLALNWGIIPILYEGEPSDEAKMEFAVERAKTLGYVHAGDIVIATAGHSQLAGGTNNIRVATIP